MASELRGTIAKALGQKRNKNIVQAVSHQDKENKLIGFYDGSKEPEKTLVVTYFEHIKNLQGSAYSFDALHTNSKLLDLIEAKKGIYLAQVKKNQKYLLEDVQHIEQYLEAHYSAQSRRKRAWKNREKTRFFIECLAKRWFKTGVKTLIVISPQSEKV